MKVPKLLKNTIHDHSKDFGDPSYLNIDSLTWSLTLSSYIFFSKLSLTV